MTNRSAAPRRQPPCSVTRGPVGPNTRSRISIGYGGILQADAYAGYNALFRSDRSPAPLARALCWAHARRKFFELADVVAH